MRDITSWRQPITAALRQSNDLINHVLTNFDSLDDREQKREISKLAQVIADVELGLTLHHLVIPSQPATCVEALLSGNRFPVPELENDENWRLVQKARFYLVRRKGRQWMRTLEIYIQIDQILRIYRLSDPNNVPQLTASSTYPKRFELYHKTLQTTPKHKPPDIKLATEGLWYALVTQPGHGAVNIPIYIPEKIANIAPTDRTNLIRTRSDKNESYRVNLDELLRVDAVEMDRMLLEGGHKAENYHQRLDNILLELYKSNLDNFEQAREFEIDKLIHIVGLLNVGKSTLLEVLIYHLTKNKKHRCALIVNDVGAAVRLASMFWHKLGIQSAPVLGSSERAEQLVKAYKSILEKSGDEITKGAVHPAWRWFSPICPLLSLSESDHTWEFGSEPCHSLYPPKKPDTDSPREIDDASQIGQLDRTDELEEWDFIDDKKGRTCPFYYKCPRHQLERDISQAYIWVLTPASFIHTRVPSQGFEQKILIAEAVYRECNFLFIDEADRVQIQFDEAFAPSQVLLDETQNSLLNQLGVKTAPLYNSNRSLMVHPLYRTWMSVQYTTQNAANHICERLYNNPNLVQWVGIKPFTGSFLFAQIIRSFTDSLFAEISDEQERSNVQRKKAKSLIKTLEGFIQDPMNRRSGKELTDLATTILNSKSDRLTFVEIHQWVSAWLLSNDIPIPDENKLPNLISKIHLAILVIILDNQLGYLVDNIRQLSQTRLIDLHDVSEALIHRPPLDYLPVMPQAPVGNILGFRYVANRGKRGGKLEYFRYVGVGRTLLLRFPTLFAIDDWDGAHTVLISGTSYAPGSPAYHVRVEPTVLLRPVLSDAGIADSEFSFSPRTDVGGNHIAISGKPSELRRTAVESMIKSISQSSKRNHRNSFLDGIFEKLKELEKENPCWWADRKRLLIIVGSYLESELAADVLRREYTIESTDSEGVMTLRRDNAPAHKYGIPRSQIQERYSEITIVPLMALERGHNILNNEGKAAFGAAIFLNRPMPVPDDWQATVRQLNDWAIVNERNYYLYSDLLQGEPLTLPTASLHFYQLAVKKMRELNTIPMNYAALTPSERSVLCSTQMVRIWQIIGRLVRGGVPCLVYFMDVKFAPKSAKKEKDTETTSLIVGIIKELESYINAPSSASKTLAKSLYGAFLTSLKNTNNFKGL